MAGKAQNLPNCHNAPNSRKVLEIRSITLFRSLSAVALAKADAFCAFLWLKNPCNQCNPWLMNYLHAFGIFTTVVSALQINLFMQNKAKFRKSQMNVNKVLTKDYGKRTLGQRGKKQSQTNPNKAKFKKAEMNVTSYITKGYENISPIRAPKKQSQTLKRKKPIANLFDKKGYDNEVGFSLQKTNPNKPNLRGKKCSVMS